jgi:histidine triad (HIT) family protein
MSSSILSYDVASVGSSGCPFCDYAGPSPVLFENDRVFVIEPLTPVVPGHVLVIPKRHVADAFEDPAVTGMTAKLAVRYARASGIRAANIITSVGTVATQTVRHLHVHIVPRAEDDGLRLPWT